jgi:hypothetical protein
MDADSFKTVSPILGGLLTLVGGVFAFVNGRLNEARDAEGKTRVIRVMQTWISLSLSAASMAITFLFSLLAALPLYLVTFIFQSYLFLRDSSPPSRWDVLAYGLLCASLASMSTMGITLYLVERIVELQAGTIASIKHDREVQDRTIDLLKRETDLTEKLVQGMENRKDEASTKPAGKR